MSRTRIEKLYNKAKKSPNNLSFSDLCLLLEKVGFEFRRQKGSPLTFKHPQIQNIEGIQEVQNVKGKAKAYQVKQVLDKIDSHNLYQGRE